MTLFDTDVLIDVLRGDPMAVEVVERAGRTDRPALSAVSRMELLVGCRDKDEQRRLGRFLLRFETVHLNERVSARAVLLVERYRLSHGLQIPDALIAAAALEAGCRLISKNQKDSRFIDGLRLASYPPAE